VLDSHFFRTMKQVRVIVLSLVLGGCAYLLYRALHRSPAPKRAVMPQVVITHCDQGLGQYVYNPRRLRVINPCISVIGMVEQVRKEADGDVHIRFRLDQEFESLLTEKNISRQQGDLVLEPICQGKVRQLDATESCSRYNGPYFEPQVGLRYLVWGTLVYDADHGWNELHPITSMHPIQ
jgi:hypothetical protein